MARGGDGPLDAPLPVLGAEGGQAQSVRHLRRLHRVGQVLLVRQDQQDRVPEVLLLRGSGARAGARGGALGCTPRWAALGRVPRLSGGAATGAGRVGPRDMAEPASPSAKGRATSPRKPAPMCPTFRAQPCPPEPALRLPPAPPNPPLLLYPRCPRSSQSLPPPLPHLEHAHQLLPRLPRTVAVVRVHDEDDALRVLEVVPPQGADLVLATHIPHCGAGTGHVRASPGARGAGGPAGTGLSPVKEMFLYSTVSTLKPIVGMVVTISPSLSLYRMVVLPAASSPTIRMRISRFENRRVKILEKASPMSVRPLRAQEGASLRGGPKDRRERVSRAPTRAAARKTPRTCAGQAAGTAEPSPGALPGRRPNLPQPAPGGRAPPRSIAPRARELIGPKNQEHGPQRRARERGPGS